MLGWGNVRKLYGLIIQGSWEGRRSEFAGVGRWCRMWTAVCVMHQQFTSLSQLRLFVSRRSWNPTSTRSIAANKEYHLSRHSSHSGNAFLRFCTWTIVSSLFSRNTLYPSSSLRPRSQSFIVQEFFATSPVMSRSNAPWTIEIHAQLGTHTCFLSGIYIIYTQRFSIFSVSSNDWFIKILLKKYIRSLLWRKKDNNVMILKIIYIIFRNVHWIFDQILFWTIFLKVYLIYYK